MRQGQTMVFGALSAALAAVAVAPAAVAADVGFALSGGAEYTSGEYGGDSAIEEVYVPFTGTLDFRRVAVSLTVPFLSVRAPELTVIDVGGQPVVGEGPPTTESGLGDVLLMATLYDVLVVSDGDFALDLTGKVKFGSADADQGLGTGEEDYTVQFDAFRFFDRATLIGIAGYSFRGDPQGVALDDTPFASLGGSVKLAPGTTLGAFYDWRESSIEGSDALREATVSLTSAVGAAGRLQAYGLAGFSDSSPDWGLGLAFSFRW